MVNDPIPIFPIPIIKVIIETLKFISLFFSITEELFMAKPFGLSMGPKSHVVHACHNQHWVI